MQQIKRLKTKPWQRQLSLARTSTTASLKTTTHLLSNLWLPRDKREQANRDVLARQAGFVAEELGKLKGSAVKIGQMMAIFGDGLLPQEVCDVLRSLEAPTAMLDWKIMAEALKVQLGDAWEDFEIDPVPVGAASLAQVHKAFHRPTGRTLCLKLQYPGVRDSVDSDLQAVSRLLILSRLIKKDALFDRWVSDVRELLHFELDYEREAAMTQMFFDKLADDHWLHIPQVIHRFCTPTLLVTGFAAGCMVTDASVAALTPERRNALGEAFLSLFLKELFVFGVMQTDPNFGNYLIGIENEKKDYLTLLDFGSVLAFEEDFLQPVREMLLGAIVRDVDRVKKGALDLGIMQPHFPDDVQTDFARLCELLVEPFLQSEQNCQYFNDSGAYLWAKSQLPKRAAKLAARSALSPYFSAPPQSFVFLSRKLLGVYRFIAELDAEFDPSSLIAPYIEKGY